MTGYGSYLIVVVIAMAVMASAVYALHWAVKHGQFRNLEAGATEIFDDEEPMGTPTDRFPPKRAKGKTAAAGASPTASRHPSA